MLENKYLKISLMICTTIVWCLMIEQATLSAALVLGTGGTHDTYLARTVAHGITNGLKPYVDLYENKSPGLFLMLAASFLLFNTPILGNIIQVLSLVIYPAGLGYLAWRYTKAKLHYVLIPLSMIVGGIFAMMAVQPIELYVAEIFGALAGFLYLFTIALPGRARWPRILTAAFFLLAAAGFKEPFAPMLMVSALVLFIDRPKLLLTRFVLPGAIAALTGIAALYALGWIQPWLYYITNEIGLTKTYNAYRTVYPNEPAITTVLRESYYRTIHYWKNYSVIMSPFMAILAATICFHEYAVNRSFKKFFLTATAILLAGIIMLLMVGLRNHYFIHHYVFCVPLFVALYIKWLMQAKERPATPITNCVYILPIYVFTILTLVTAPLYSLPRARAGVTIDYSAVILDQIMDACHIDRYLYLAQSWAYFTGSTTHSPYGPAFLQAPLLPDTIEDNYVRRRYLYNLQHAALAVAYPAVTRQEQLNNLPTLLGSDFTLDAPSCAQPYMSQITNYRLYFRIHPVTDTTPPPMPY